MSAPAPIRDEHRARKAVVYVRQSSPSQVRISGESARLQRDLQQRAIAIGWSQPLVIDEDLGVSAAGYAERPGFQRLLSMVAMREVGIVLCIDASRLSRNSKDWAHLFELCAYFGTLIADLDQVYDLTAPNDRLVMGIKGTMSELELTILRRRLQGGLESKAARGELRINLPAGYVYDGDDIVMDPDQRVQAAIRLMFDQFDRSSSIRQLAMWYRDQDIAFPVKPMRRSASTQWKIPTSKTLRKLLKHPIYAGCYVYGRRATVVDFVDGRLVKRETEPRPVDQSKVCLHDHHAAYITWDRLLANLRKIGKNHVRWAMQQSPGVAREGLALLSGLLRCGQCGGKIYVGYKPRNAIYFCDGGHEKGSKRCLAFGSQRIDQRVVEELCRAVEPLAVEAALLAARDVEQQLAERGRHAELELEAARYAADRAFAQYDQCDPQNRLVADTLERRWNERLAEVRRAEERLETCRAEVSKLSMDQERQLRELASDFPTLWKHPAADARLRKNVLRAAIREVLVRSSGDGQEPEVTVHWQGGAHTRFTVQRRTRGSSGQSNSSLEALVRTLAETLSDAEMARVLNMRRTTTPGGLRWTRDRVRDYRRLHHIRLEPGRTEGVLTMSQAMRYLGVGHSGIVTLAERGIIDRNQASRFAPWRVSRAQLESERVQRVLGILKATGRLPRGGWPENQRGLFDADTRLTSENESGAS
ncbi:MAG: recombinase family protein [Planctomycetes bacterium]|nr:recombinase family protein [Planctomycetota bacterium]